jgi:DNA-binding NtrC family response regulator
MTSLATKNVLAVDDEEVMLKMYRDYFAQRGVKLRTATSADETLRVVQEQPADVIIMDLKLGEASGKDVLHRIRQEHPDTCWIFVTAYVTEALIQELYGMGVFEVIRKPCTIRTIFETVEKVVESSLASPLAVAEEPR